MKTLSGERLEMICEWFQVDPSDVDYITCFTGGKETKVPVLQEFSITCMPIYSRKSISQQFGLRDFASGKLLGSSGGRGTFI